MRNRWPFAGVHLVLAVVLVLLVDISHGSTSGSAVGSALGSVGQSMFASVVMPFLAGFATWAIFNGNKDAPAPGFGGRYTLLTFVAMILFWIVVGFSAAFSSPDDNTVMQPIYLVTYVAPVVIVIAALLSLRRWNLFATDPSCRQK